MKVETTTDNINTSGMLDQDILTLMLRESGVAMSRIGHHLPEIMRTAQVLYGRETPSLRTKVCPGVRVLLNRLKNSDVPSGLVTGNLTRIGWRKMELAGLRRYFRFGAFSESARTRAGLAKIAIREAQKRRLIDDRTRVSLIGDHPNDVQAAHANGVQSIAVLTGLSTPEELSAHGPHVLVPDMRSLTLEMFF